MPSALPAAKARERETDCTEVTVAQSKGCGKDRQINDGKTLIDRSVGKGVGCKKEKEMDYKRSMMQENAFPPWRMFVALWKVTSWCRCHMMLKRVGVSGCLSRLYNILQNGPQLIASIEAILRGKIRKCC